MLEVNPVALTKELIGEVKFAKILQDGAIAKQLSFVSVSHQ